MKCAHVEKKLNGRSQYKADGMGLGKPFAEPGDLQKMLAGSPTSHNLRTRKEGGGSLELASLVHSILICMLLLQPATVLGREVALDPETGLMRILYIGDCYGESPFLYMSQEPLFDTMPLPASIAGFVYTVEQMQRHIRLYMPRSFEEHVSKYDIVVLSDTSFDLYRPEHLMWFKRGVIDWGQGILMVGGYLSFGGDSPDRSWAGSSVEDVLPVYCLEAKMWEGWFLPVPADEDHPFCTSLDWGLVQPFLGLNIVNSKNAAVEVLSPSSDGADGPLLVYWDIGEGSALAHMPDLTPGWGKYFMLWEYYPDYIANMFYLLARLEVPQDVNLMHAVRASMNDYFAERALVISLLEFVGRFGADPGPLEERIIEIDEMKSSVDRMYSDQQYESILHGMEEISDALFELNVEAMELKKRALMWVYIIEWLIVTGTLILSGFLLWSLMVRRKLYREVAYTRLE